MEEKLEMFPDGRIPKKCLALALSDAVNLGPYQAGVIQGLFHEISPRYQVVTGIAMGAINAHIVAQHKLGDETEASDMLEDFWTTLAQNNADVVKSWSWGLVYGFFYENSLYDASPLYDFFENYFRDSKFYRHMNIGIANVLDGRFKSFSQKHGSDELVKVLQASVSFPGVFKAVEAFDSIWFSGSSMYEIDILTAIRHCTDMGYEEEDIIIDVILSGNPHLPHALANFYNSVGVA
jgi:predicted acylesterase/phospholipase RssA